jgi:hypothetical protein
MFGILRLQISRYICLIFSFKNVAILGCKKCYSKNREIEITPGKTIEDLYESTKLRKFKLEKKGYQIHEIWECQWKNKLKKDKQLKKEWEKIFVPKALHPRRDALRGGRVEAFQLYSQCGPDEVIEHYDIVSLFRFIVFFNILKKIFN